MKAFENLKKKIGNDEKCARHSQSLVYFCTTCKKAICSDCAMFEIEHKGHNFEHLEKTYKHIVEDIKEKSCFLKDRLASYRIIMKEVRKSIDTIKKAKDEKSDEILRIMKILNEKLEKQLSDKMRVLMSNKTVLGDEMKCLENIQKKIEKEISESNKSNLVEKSKDFINELDELKFRPEISLNADVSPDFEYFS